MARDRVKGGKPGINMADYDMLIAFQEAGKILDTPGSWKDGIAYDAPYDWGNPTFTEAVIKNLLPEFWTALTKRNQGPKDNQILYINYEKDFFIVTRGQNIVLCKNKSCVQPDQY